MRWIVLVITAAAAAYQLLAILAALSRKFRRSAATSGFTPRVSILKPVRGADPGFYEAIRSNAVEDYPDFEILFGVASSADSAIPHIERLAREFPERRIRLVCGPTGRAERQGGKARRTRA